MISGETVKAIRKRLNFTQQDFAEALGVTVSTVYKWETKFEEFIPRKYWSKVKTLRKTTRQKAQLRHVLYELSMDLEENDLEDVIELIEERIENANNKNMRKNKRKTP